MTSNTLAALFVAVLGDGGDDGGDNLPPGSPPTCQSTHLLLVLAMVS